jgi:hypothetical protein
MSLREKGFKTIFSDIDGTLIEQVDFNELDPNVVNVLEGVKEKMNEWYESGHCILLTTARPEELREVTVKQMEIAGIRYHQLIMGVGRDERILINNNSKATPNVPRALSVAVPRDNGFENIQWNEVGL